MTVNRTMTGQEPSIGAAAPTPVTLDEALDKLRDLHGETLGSLSDRTPTVVVLLRHTGCTFCRQTLGLLGEREGRIEREGYAIGVVGMTESAEPMRALGERFGVRRARYFADPQRLAYRALGVGRGSVRQLIGPTVIWKGLRAAFAGFGIGRPKGDPFQMPGAAIVHKRAVLRRFRASSAADMPDFDSLACSMSPG